MIFSTGYILFVLAVTSNANWKVGVIYQSDKWTDLGKPLNNGTGTAVQEYILHQVDNSDALSMYQKVSNLSESDVIGIIAFTSCPTAAVLQEQTASTNLPLITIDNEVCPQTYDGHHHLSVLSNCHSQNSQFIDIVLHMKWEHVNVIYDSESSFCIQELIVLLTKKNVLSNVIFLPEGQHLTLEIFQEQGSEEVIYVATAKERTLSIVSEAMAVDMFNRSFYWVLNLDPYTLWNSILYKPVHEGCVLLISAGLQQNETTTADLLLEALLVFQRGLDFTGDGRYVTDLKSLRYDLHQYMMDSSNETRLIDKESHARVFSSAIDEETLFQKVAEYSQEPNGFHVVEDRLYKCIFKDFGNRTLKVVSVEDEPFQMRVDKGNGSFYYYGFTYDLLNEFAKQFNFRYEFLDSVDGLYGNPTNDNKNASGMIGMVMRGEADIAVGPFTITAERRKVVDFIYPFQEEGSGIIVRKVDNEADRIFRVFSPLDTDSWLATGAAAFVAAVVLSIIVKLSPFSKGLHNKVSASFWLVFSAFLHQGEEKSSKSVPARLVMGFWWVFTIIVMSLYTANLAAFLTVSLGKAPIKNLEELAAQSVYKPLISDGTNLHMLFKKAEKGIYKKIWDMMRDMPKLKSLKQVYEMIIKGNYAYITDESEARFMAMKDCKNLEMAEETFNKGVLSFVIRKNAEFKRAFDKHMLKMVQIGMVDKYRKIWWDKHSCHSANTATELEFKSTSGIFIVYSSFIFFSVICCLVELYLRGRKFKKNRVRSSSESLQDISVTMIDN
ncbi:glutamate receptor ionotropic, kainate 2-like isoform X2 [Magallana gigas]|uniref:glutamate receptor ionotropic, kainate 2-like isoform X2 n=1 Tax=Magallana gigas TaxID=29159 RepID=UPI00333E22A9